MPRAEHPPKILFVNNKENEFSIRRRRQQEGRIWQVPFLLFQSCILSGSTLIFLPLSPLRLHWAMVTASVMNIKCDDVRSLSFLWSFQWAQLLPVSTNETNFMNENCQPVDLAKAWTVAFQLRSEHFQLKRKTQRERKARKKKKIEFSSRDDDVDVQQHHQYGMGVKTKILQFLSHMRTFDTNSLEKFHCA